MWSKNPSILSKNTEPEKTLARSLAKSYQNIYEVQEVTEGKGLRIKDMFTGDELFVHEVSGSYSAVKWDLVMVRIYQTDGMYKFAGNGSVPPRQNFDGLIKFLEKKRDEFQEKTSKSDWPAFMKERSYMAHQYFDELAENPPVVVTEEKHRVILARAHFESLHFDKILHIIGREFDFVVEESVPNKSAQLTWLKRGASKGWKVNENPPEHHIVSSFSLVHGTGQMSWTTLGTITLSADKLILECFSKERLERGKKRLQELLVDLIRHKVDEFEDIYVGMERVREREKGEKSKSVTGAEAAILESMLRKHYEKWPDENIPALGNMTPREAMKTKEGRQKVDELLKSFENMEERKRKLGEHFVNLSFLRKELGL